MNVMQPIRMLNGLLIDDFELKVLRLCQDLRSLSQSFDAADNTHTVDTACVTALEALESRWNW